MCRAWGGDGDKVTGMGRALGQDLLGGVGMGMISVPVQLSTLDTAQQHHSLTVKYMLFPKNDK